MSAADQKLFSSKGEESHTHGVLNEDGYFDAANSTLQRMVGEALAKYYPGHPWGVMAEIEHGIVKIALQGFIQWPYVLHVSSLKGDPAMKAVMRGAGELLERLDMPRNGFQLDAWRQATRNKPHHFYRNAKPPE
jgi:hypothetical protein